MIGDVLISSIICNNLKTEYPDAQIDYLVYDFTFPVIENNPNIDNVILFDKKKVNNFLKLLKFAFEIRKKNYDIVIDAYAKLESGIVTLFSGAERRISYKQKGLQIAYNEKIDHLNTSTSSFGLAIDRKIVLFKSLINKNSIDPYPKLFLTDLEKKETLQLFKDFNIDKSKNKVIMFSIFGSEKAKTYPLEYMLNLIEFTAQNTNCSILFNYTNKQKQDALQLFQLCSSATQKKIQLDLIGTDLRSFIKIMDNCDLIIGNDGGAVNIAKALNKPSFTIFSPWIKKENWSIFEDGKTHIGVHLFDFYPELKKQFELKKLKEEYHNFYLKLKPELFSDKLNTFLNQNIKS